MRITAFLLLLFSLHIVAIAGGQIISLSAKETPLKTVIQQIEKQSGYSFIYGEELLKKSNPVTVQINSAGIGKVLEAVFKNQPLDYKVSEKYIVLSLRQSVSQKITDPPPPIDLRGRVTNENGEPLEGVTVTIKGTKKGTATNRQGQFTLHVEDDKAHLTITSVGFAPIAVLVQGNKLTVEPQTQAAHGVTEGNARSSASMDQNGFISVKLVRLVREEDAVVITGIVNKRKESFTGSAATYTQKELREVGGTNILQSLKTLDPAFSLRDDVQFGSDPNRLPDIEIRGKSSLLGQRDELTLDPNQPLFILDGFESSLAAINDLDINRVESITILKDAASTAMYGSKAANGVVVVETVKPKAGKLQVDYRSRYNISAPDLSSYNMMDAREKLEFERLSGRFDPHFANSGSPTQDELIMAELYNERLRKIEEEGVNTYWLAEPLRIGANQNHFLSVAGGEGNFTFGLSGSYNGNTGVMKESERNTYQGSIALTYRTSKLQFGNTLTLMTSRFQNPIVGYSSFSNANPFYKKTNNGVVEQWLENTATTRIANPLWDATRGSRNIGKDLNLINSFNLDWFLSNSWRVNARLGLTMGDNETEIFTSPDASSQLVRDISRRGRFNYTNTKSFRSEQNLMVHYNKVFNKNRIHLSGGGNINTSNSLGQGYMVEGFTSGATGGFTYPNFSRGFPQNSANPTDYMPVYIDNISGAVNALFIGSYAFNDRYLIDVSLRSSGSSVFGTNRRFNNTWSVGLGWNLHRERFISDMDWINFLRIRGSVGNPGNQNFNNQVTQTTYRYSDGIYSYFGLAARPDRYGNPDLQWQITRDKNIGFDLTAFNRRFSINVDYWHKRTDPLLIRITVPSSSGSSQDYTNAGEQTGQGLNFLTSYQILRNTERRIYWSIRATGRAFQKQRIDKIGNKLDQFNKAGRGNTLVRYRDGADPDDIWAIRSLGIDPASGQELYLTKDGNPTFVFSYDHEVILGNSRPDLEGIVGSSITLGGFVLNLNFRYQFGAEVFNFGVRNKVENLNINNNQDRRALYDRWQKPGDIRYFRDIRDNRFAPMSSRFVQTEKTFSMEGISASYEFRGGWVKKARLNNFTISASTRDIFRFSTMQVERGISYPFERYFDFGLSINF